jgi:hypothetical protein
MKIEFVLAKMEVFRYLKPPVGAALVAALCPHHGRTQAAPLRIASGARRRAALKALIANLRRERARRS